ncbi:MAG: biopolymer transporter ExbD [Candidatus Gastranaerophilales bacterium]|nr:biopolymer transporter ExbD [Candidatus Gastranaerophilales bacterium]
MARQKRQVFNDINITPLTDIFLVLLIIMMVIAPLLDQQGLSLIVPEHVEQKDIQEHKTVNVVIDNEDKFFINDEEVSADKLEETIKKLAVENPEGVVIETSEETTNGAMVKVMDSARNVGVTSISVAEI